MEHSHSQFDVSHNDVFSCDVLWRARLFSPFLDQPNVGTRFTELTVSHSSAYRKWRGLFLPFPLSASSLRCVCVAQFSVFVGSRCPVSGKAHIGYKVMSHHVYVWSLIPQHNSMTSYLVSKKTHGGQSNVVHHDGVEEKGVGRQF